ncbi:MAG: hypothetical protein IJV76_08850, partial [Clostridia bacterium]|nr:hypothetical protein [Clostridia bacterium]
MLCHSVDGFDLWRICLVVADVAESADRAECADQRDILKFSPCERFCDGFREPVRENHLDVPS